MKDLDELLGIALMAMSEREKERETRLRAHCLAVKKFQSGVNMASIYPFYGDISEKADYAGEITIRDDDGQEFHFHFRAMKGIAKDPFIDSLGELCQTPWFIPTLIAKSQNDAPLSREHLAAAEVFKQEHRFPLTCAIIEIIEIMTQESS